MWKTNLPVADQRWVSKALFTYGPTGKMEVKAPLSLWYNPPQAPNTCNRPPIVNAFFTHSLLCWMPYRLFRPELKCTRCNDKVLTGAGVYKRPRMVLDVDRFYILVTEKVQCTNPTCRRPYTCWEDEVLNQLDVATRSKFPVIVTRKWVSSLEKVLNSYLYREMSFCIHSSEITHVNTFSSWDRTLP